ncbi:wiskott-Aldrich syndrome protein family member 2 [Tetranychus urticae]|uniref:Uncharacterized protein n=1 Tax=Tetranychus urticae TaxID=32264 RepID=T1K0S3_TETUR|nr:wiskott-Aldrich syndrome protein family member 2 [Tetranychus urticae]
MKGAIVLVFIVSSLSVLVVSQDFGNNFDPMPGPGVFPGQPMPPPMRGPFGPPHRGGPRPPHPPPPPFDAKLDVIIGMLMEIQQSVNRLSPPEPQPTTISPSNSTDSINITAV